MTTYFWLLENVEEGRSEIVESTEYPDTFRDGSRWTSRSRRYDSRAELLEGEEILTTPCACCGGLVRTRYIMSMKEQLIRKGMCFVCNAWDERQHQQHDKNIMIVNHIWYTLYINLDDGDQSPYERLSGYYPSLDMAREALREGLWND